jgi:diguanylate cyclase (GGDEF)-like protein/PAS domain S-box-containing protein
MSRRAARWWARRRLPLLVFLVGVIVSTALVWRLEQQRVGAQRTVLFSLATDHAKSVESRIDRLLSSTYLLAAALRKDKGQVVDFETIAHEVLPFYPGITALSLSPNGVIRHVVPLEPNRGSLGFNQLQDPAQSPEAFRARDTGQLTLAGPLNLVQGGLGVVGRLPVFINDHHGVRQFWGFVNVTIRFPDALNATGLEILRDLGYDYELWRTQPQNGQRQVIAASAPGPLIAPVNKNLRVPNAEWTLSLAPIHGWHSLPRIGLSALAGVLLSLLLAYVARLWVALALHREQLEQTVSERTADIVATQTQLAATLDALPDLLFEIDEELRVHLVHTQHPELLMMPAAEVIGRKASDLMPPEVLDVVREAITEARQRGRSNGKQYQLAVQGAPHGAWFELSVAVKPGQGPGGPRYILLARDITQRKQAEQAQSTLQERLVLAFEASSDAPWDWNPQTNELYMSAQWWRMVGEADLGTTRNDDLFRQKYIHPEDAQIGVKVFRDAVAAQQTRYSFEFRLKHRDGHSIPVLVRARINYDTDGRPVRVSGTHQDLTHIRMAQRRETVRSFLLNLLAQDLSLPELLEQTVAQLETSLPGSLCTILLLDEEHKHIQQGFGHSMPASFLHAFNGMAIGPNVGSCGASAHSGQPVYIADIATHPNWAPFREIAQAAGLAACWSQPVLLRDGQVAGTFAVYHRTVTEPHADDAQLLEMAARFVALAIERKQAESELQLSAAVFENSSEGFLVTDAQQRIVKVNPAFTRITGYGVQDILGKTPRHLASGHQNREFYANMWHELNTTGQWQGEVWNRRKDGQVYPEWLSITRVLDPEGQPRHYIAIFSDTSQRKAHEAQIRALAHFDPLTGLANRTLLKDRVDHDLSQAKRHHQPLTLMFLDLDHFKNINDSLGHHIGDLLLVEVGRRISGVVREQDTVARLGGDEFVAVLPGTSAQEATHIARRLLERISQPYQLEQHELNITPSIGLALYPVPLRRHRHVPRQARRTQRLQLLHRGDAGQLHPHTATGQCLAQSPGTRTAQPALPAPAVAGLGRHRGCGSLAAMEPPRMGPGIAGRICAGGRKQRANHPDRRMGAALRLPAAQGMARCRPARDGDGGQPLCGPIPFATAARNGDGTAGGGTPAPRMPGAGADRKRGHARPTRCHRHHEPAARPRHPDVGGRFRHRLLQLELPQAFPRLQTQDRHVFRARHVRRPGRRVHRQRHHQPRPEPGAQDHRRRRRNPRPDGHAAWAGLQRNPGLPHRPTDGCTAV